MKVVVEDLGERSAPFLAELLQASTIEVLTPRTAAERVQARNDGAYDGKANLSNVFRLTDVWSRSARGWQVVARHSSILG